MSFLFSEWNFVNEGNWQEVEFIYSFFDGFVVSENFISNGDGKFRVYFFR